MDIKHLSREQAYELVKEVVQSLATAYNVTVLTMTDFEQANVYDALAYDRPGYSAAKEYETRLVGASKEMVKRLAVKNELKRMVNEAFGEEFWDECWYRSLRTK